jgi:branched-chain amino acid transport system substrate-binding protein
MTVTLALRTRPWQWQWLAALVVALFVSACSTSKVGGLFQDDGQGAELVRQAEGGRKVALLLPLSASGETRKIAQAMKQAAELALVDAGGSGLTLITKDSGGTAQGAQAAAQAALNEGAELILGPLLSTEVQAVKAVAQGRANIIAFSSQSAVAGNGTYLLSFLPEEEVANVVRYAAEQNQRKIAALYPATQYGQIIEQALIRASQKDGVSIAAADRYTRDGLSVSPAIQKVAQAVNSQGADTVLIPESGETLRAIGVALSEQGVDSTKVKILGTGLWDNPATRNIPIAQGGWYAGVSPEMVERFASRYSSTYGGKPPRIASLAYDAVSLAMGLAKQGSFEASAITSSDGFQGQNGLFRFRKDGRIERGLAILEITSSGSQVVAEAPSRFSEGY